MSPPASEPATEDTNYARQIRNTLWALLVLALIAGLYVARDFVLPVVLALFIALTLRPAIRYLGRHHIPPWLAASVFVSLLMFSSASALYFLSGPVASWYDQAPELMKTFSEKFSALRASLDTLTNLTETIQNGAKPANVTAVQEVVVRGSPLPAIFGMLTGYPIQFLITLIATLVIAVFLMASGDLFYQKLVRILPTLTERKRALHIVYEIENEVSAYVFTLAAINLCLGVVMATIFYFLGMPVPYLWGVLIFLFNFIPYVGPVFGVVLSGFMAVVAFDSFSYALIVPLTYAICSVLESEILRPQILGRRLQMNSVAILLSLAFWTWMWGISGAAIAVPLLVTIKVFCEHMDGLSGLGEFIAARQVDPPGEQQN